MKVNDQNDYMKLNSGKEQTESMSVMGWFVSPQEDI